jgi:tetratricopeptide (TPR) repeat protein
VICVRSLPCRLVALSVAVWGAAPAWAATPEEMARAREHFAAGRTHYDLKEYEPALAAFKDAYRFVQDPVFLFNIAQCHWKLGREREAVDFYKSYLRRAPNAPNRPEVERRVQELEAAIKAHPAPPLTPPREPVTPAPGAPAVAPPPVPEPAVVPPVVTAERPAPPRIYRRWWFWAGAAAIAVAAGAITLGLARRGQVGDCMGIAPCRDLGP